jgi:serine/threonine-protein kinase HipA
MPTSEEAGRVYVWTWLPGAVEPVVAGAAERRGDVIRFFYANSYLERADAISLYAPELPLTTGYQDPPVGLTLAGCLRDATPDAWGRRVIEARLRAAENSLPEETYMLQSGTNRFGALDFQARSDVYRPDVDRATLDELHEAAQRLIDGRPLSREMEEALAHGTTIGGAWPKVLVEGSDGVQWIAKLSAASDTVFSVINAEAAAMELARAAGIDTAHTEVTRSLGRDVLLVRRFDRTGAGSRCHVVSGLTMAGEDELGARYVTYPSILDVLRERGSAPALVGRELFDRIAFNIAVGNSDDHARNHAAFWDGDQLTLTPAYDLAPGSRHGETATQAMAFDYDGKVRASTFAALLSQASVYGLSQRAARERIGRLVESVRAGWQDAADQARLRQADREHLWGRQILNPAAFFDF